MKLTEQASITIEVDANDQHDIRSAIEVLRKRLDAFTSIGYETCDYCNKPIHGDTIMHNQKYYHSNCFKSFFPTMWERYTGKKV